MPKSIVPPAKVGPQNRYDVNNNCTKVSADNIINGGEENGEENEFHKATKVFQGYLYRCGLSKVLMGGLTELHKNQKDIEDPTLFLKTYLEIASGTGKDFDKLKQIFAELSSAILGVNSVVGKIRSELISAKDFVDTELNQLKSVTADAAAAAADLSTDGTATSVPSGIVESGVTASEADGADAATIGGEYSIADLTPEERLLAEKMRRIEGNAENLREAEQRLRDIQRSVDGLRMRLEVFGDKMKEGLVVTKVEEVVVSSRGDEEERDEEDREGPGITFDCEVKATEEEEEEGEKVEDEGEREEELAGTNANRLLKRKRKVGGRSLNRGNRNRNNDDQDDAAEPAAAAKEGKQKTVVKEIQSKVGSKDNEQHKAGGGTTKVYDKKEDYTNVKSKAGANDNIGHKAGGGTTKVFNEKQDYSNVKSKAGANDNIDHKAAGGTNKIFNEKQDYSNVKSKAGANDNIDHKAAGGTTKVFNEKQDYSNVKSKAGANDNIDHKAAGGTTKVFNEKQDYSNVKSKAGANDNIKHKAGGGEKKVFDEKVVYK